MPSKRIDQKAAALSLVVALMLSACQEAPPEPSPTSTALPAVPAGTTATPRPLANPVLIDRQPAPGEELSIDQPLVLTFDQTMDRASVEQALRVQTGDDPQTFVAGTIEWQQDNVVAFKPAQGWQRAARYQVTLQDTAKSARGLQLARPAQFQVNTIGYLSVAQTIPADGASDVAADGVITILFNRPVVPLTGLDRQASLPQPVTFEPSIEGSGEWLNTSIYVFRPSKPLAAGVLYTGRVAAGLQDTAGALLQEDYIWTFSVAAPIVKAVDPGDGSADVDLRRPISITFSQKMNRPSAEAAFTIDPPVRGSFRWADEVAELLPQTRYGEQGDPPAPGMTPQFASPAGEVMAFVPEEDYQRGVTYRVTIAETARAAVGEAGLRAATSFSFRSIELPAVAATTPANGAERAETNAGFNIRFTAPVLPETVLPNLSFEPPISLTGVYTYYDPQEKRFYLGVDFKPSTDYRVTIGGAIADRYGVQIGRPTVVRFTTAPLSPYAVLRTDNQIGTYNASRPVRLFAAYRNISRLDFELARLTLNDFYQMTGSPDAWRNWYNFQPARDQMLRRWSVQARREPNATFFYEVALPDEEQSLTPGLYVLTLSAPEPAAQTQDYRPERHILVVTNQHVTLKQGEFEALAWVTDLTSGRPVEGAPVTFYDRSFSPIANGTTDADGQVIGRYDYPTPLYEAFYAIVGEPGQSGFGVGYNNWDRGLAPWEFNLSTRFYGDPFNVYLYTDRPIYRPGQMVYFKGIARLDNDARYSLILASGQTESLPIVATISNDRGQQVFSTTLSLDEYGAFTGAFVLDNNAPTGFYGLNVCVPDITVRGVGHKGRGLSAPTPPDYPCRTYGTSFQVAAYRAPDFEVTVTTDKSDYLAGETVNATVDARYFFGGNVANAKVEWSLFARDYFFDRYTGQGWYTWGNYELSYRGISFNEQIANGTGQTDSTGRLVIRLPADLSRRQTSAVFALEVSVTDLNDQSVSARATTIVHKSDWYVGIASEVYVGVTGEPATMNLIAVDRQGQP
ncbi:MAG: Ig-like domain-containing protein, partial [Anaerolineae bacterium]|nr:Ig-like domain-containing protein [Thermoflexales bacterium]MDW8408125.1 Ig-like domain-containing protein [Anaerolineae bacterium]